MKRRAAKIKKVVGSIVVTTMFIVLFLVCSWYETHYTREARVIAIDNEIVSVIDKTNNVWQFYRNKEAIKINDQVKLIMDTMNTDTIITDDIIIQVTVIK